MDKNCKKEKAVMDVLNIPLVLDGIKKFDNKYNLQRMYAIVSTQMIMNSFLLAYCNIMDEKMKNSCIIENRENDSKLKKIYEILDIIHKEFGNNNVKYWIIKGVGLAQYTDSDKYKRDFNDIDIVVEKNNLNRAVEIMINHGFEYSFDSQIVDKIESLECYELGFFYPFTEGGSLSKTMNNKISVEIKIGTSSIKNEKFIKYLLGNSVIRKINNVKTNILNINDTFILLCTNIYYNIEMEFAKLKIRDLFDLYYFITNNQEKLNFKYISYICRKYKISHELYRVLSLTNDVYHNLTSKTIIKIFKDDMKKYNLRIYHKYDNGSLRDWNIDFIDIMLDKNARTSEMYYEHAVKTYTSRNINFNKKIYIESLKDSNNIFDANSMLKGFKSNVNELEYSYRFNHDDKKIYFTLHFNKFKHENNMRTVLILFDVNRVSPRKMIEFSYISEGLTCRSLFDDIEVEIVNVMNNEITCSIEKKYFSVLMNKGRVLGYRMYSVRCFDGTDFAIKDDEKNFDVENCNLVYLYSSPDITVW